MDPLFIFMDLEAAHGNVYFGDIIEIAAQVDPRIMKDEVFNSLVNTKQELAYFVLEICKISRSMLQRKKYFTEVFTDFMQWVSEVVKKCSSKEHKEYYPVLVAHGGFDMDFMMVQSNLERNEINLDVLIDNNLHFADTYYFLKKMRLDDRIPYLNGSKLSIEALYKRLFPKSSFVGQHRALADVKFMIKIFLESPLMDIFDKISVATYKSRNEAFKARHTSVTETELLNNNLPKDLAKVTHTMTLKRLLRNGITYSQLQNLFKNSVSFLDFFDRLNDLGIDRKAAKSIASQLSNMGLSCSGEIYQDNRKEVGEEDDELEDIHNTNDIDGGNDINHEDGHKILNEATHVSRSDSGYESNSSASHDIDWDKFYDMFVDEFFFGPEVYEYEFGTFTLQDVEDLDNYISDLFDTRFPEYFDNLELEVCGEEDEVCGGESELDTFHKHISKMHLEKIEQVRSREVERYKDLTIPESDEKWDDELPDECEEFLIPTDRGRLGKVVPIGMTMDDFNGECFSGKVPLFKHFESVDLGCRPKGGIPKMSGKAGAKDRNRLKRENKKLQKDLDYSLINDGSQTVVKAKKTGEVFLLV